MRCRDNLDVIFRNNLCRGHIERFLHLFISRYFDFMSQVLGNVSPGRPRSLTTLIDTMDEAFYEFVVRLVLDFVFKVDVLGQDAIGVEGSGCVTLCLCRINISLCLIMAVSLQLDLDFSLTMISMSAERWLDYLCRRIPLNIIIHVIVVIISSRVMLLHILH